MAIEKSQLRKLDDYRWLVPCATKPGMRTDALIYADHRLLEQIVQDLSVEQAMNVAFLPGIVGRSLAMPDIHQGYGFPIGGVAATQLPKGVVSPGGVGFDINCGVRLLGSNLSKDDVRPKLRELVNQLFRDVPSGTGSEGFVLAEEQVVVMIHCGSRGLGHQVCTDYLKVMNEAMRRYGISLPDRQLACVPADTPEGEDYLAAMAAAANFAWANRQAITHFAR